MKINAIYGKTLEHLINTTDVRLGSNKKEYLKETSDLVSKPESHNNT